MKKLLILIFVFALSKTFAQKDKGDWHWDYCNDFEGPDAVRLKITLHYLWYFMDPPNNTMDSEYDNIFTNAQECSKYFQREYAEYPYDKKGDVRVDIDIHYHCAPCSAHNTKKEENEPKKKYSIGSRKHNRTVAESAKSCFKGNEDSYDDFLNSLGNIAENVYLDELTCKNGKLFPIWSKHDSNGKQIPLSENDRKTVYNFYTDMQGKSKAREVKKLAQQLKRAQTVKEAEGLTNTLRDMFKSNSDNTKAENVPNFSLSNSDKKNSPLFSDDKSILSSQQTSYGEQEFILDTDKNGFADTKVNVKQGERPIYQSVNGGVLNDGNTVEDFLKYSQYAMYRPDADGKLNYQEANEWRQVGVGQPLYIDLSQLDFSSIHSYEFKGIGDSKSFDLRWKGDFLKDGRVYGNLNLTYLGNGEVSCDYDTYNFDTKKWDYSTVERNISNAIGRWFAPDGTAYSIYFYGKGKINTKVPVRLK